MLLVGITVALVLLVKVDDISQDSIVGVLRTINTAWHCFLLILGGQGLVSKDRLVFALVAVLKLAQVVMVVVPSARDANFVGKF